MPKITQITRQKRNTARVSVFVDGEFAFGIDENSLYELHLQLGEELSPARRREIEDGVLASSARAAAQRYLGRSMRTEREVRRRLEEKEFPPRVISDTIEWLRKIRLLDDEEFARAYIRTRLALKPASRRKLQADLIKKGISRESAGRALEEYTDDESDADLALKLARAYAAKNTRLEPEKLKRRLAGYLQRRGFRTGDIIHALNDLAGRGNED